MNTTLRRHLVAVMSAVLLFGVLGVASPRPAVAHHDPDAGCLALGGAVVGDECVVSATVTPGPGPFTLVHTLHVTGTGYVDATGTGITINVNGEAGLDLIMDAGAVIEADDPCCFPDLNDPASDITINVSGNASMAAGSRISADNNQAGGTGGDITIDVDGDMTMFGTAGTDNCRTFNGPNPAIYQFFAFNTPNVYQDPSLGAVISAHRYGASSSEAGGNITLTVGFYGVPPTGTLTMERCSLIDASSRGSAGEIEITAGRIATIHGLVLSESALTGVPNQPRGGGPITVFAGCGLTVTDTGVISSKGLDPGADLVLLKSCEVLINGVVQSTSPGGGHVLPVNPANRCNDDPAAHPPGAAAAFTACVRILGQNVTIDATGAHNGNVNTDGIREKRTWIDIFTTRDITVLGEPAGTSVKWAISANACPPPGTAPCSNSFGGIVTLKAVGGKIDTAGQAVLQANATAIGGDGGILTIQAGGSGSGTPAAPDASSNIELDGSFIEANGPSGSNTAGGVINIKSFNGSITSEGDASGHIQALGGNPANGSITLEECNELDTYLGTVSAALITEIRSVCGGNPTLPADAAQLLADNAPIWAACVFTPPVKSGMKFNDLDNSGSLTAGDTPIADWPINLLTTANGPVASTTTAADGTYSFTIAAAGSYKVCEGSGPAGFVQTYPNALTTSPTIEGELIVNTCPAPNTWGYQFTVASGDVLEDNDFGNFKPVTCQKQTALDIMNATYPGNLGPDITVKTWLGELVQTAVDNVTDTNGDGYLIVMVIANADGSLGGTANQRVVVSRDYGNLPFGLIGCSVTLTDGGTGAAVWIQDTAHSKDITVNGRTVDIFIADLHGGFSRNGVKVDGNYRYIRNTAAKDNTGAGFNITGNYNTLHNGTAGEKDHGNGGDGVFVTGNYNKLTDVNAFANGASGFNVVGNYNQLLKLDAGDRNKGNGGDGVRVIGAANILQENKARANGGDGLDISGGTTSALANKLKKNESNTGASGSSDTENGLNEFRLAGFVKNDGGGNKADNIGIPKTSAPTKCPTFPNTNVTTSVVVNCE